MGSLAGGSDGSESGVSLLDRGGHVYVAPGPTNPPPPPDPTPPVPIRTDISQTTWGQVIPSSFGIRQVPGVPLWVSDPKITKVADTQNIITIPPVLGSGGTGGGALGSDPTDSTGADGSKSFQKWPEPTIPVATSVIQIITHPDDVAIDFAIAFGYQTRPAEERVNSRLLKLYGDGVLVYSSDSGFTGALSGLTVTWHPGYADAMPDSTMLAAIGEGCPAYRDMMYCVIQNYPVRENTAKVPTFRAEISDLNADADPEATAYTVGATLIDDKGWFVDKFTGTAYGYDSTQAEPHTIYGYDIQTQAEIGHTLIRGLPGTPTNIFTDFPFWSLFDEDNGLVLFQHGASIANSLPVAAVRVTDGETLDSFGTASSDLESSEDGLMTSYHADIIKYRAFGLTCYGVVAGGFFSEVKFLGYTHTPRAQQLPSGFSITLTRGGIVQGNDLQLVFDGRVEMLPAGSLNSPYNIYACFAYPVLDRPELKAQYHVDQKLFQDAIAIVAHGTYLTAVVAGLQVTPGYSVSPVAEFMIKEQHDILDAGAQIDEAFVNPRDGDIIVITRRNSTNEISKYHPVFDSSGSAGVVLVGLLPIYTGQPLPGYNAGGMYNPVKHSVLDSGLFGYVGELNHFIVLDIATSQKIYDELLPVDLGSHWSFDGNRMGIECASVVDNKVTHVDLFGPSGASGVLLSLLLKWCAISIGYAADEISFVNIPDTVLGGLIERPQSTRELMATLAEVFDFDQIELGGTIKFVRSERGEAASTVTLTREDLSPITEYIAAGSETSPASGTSFGQGSTPDSNSLHATIAAPDEVPADVMINYIDPTAGYIPNAQVFRRVRYPFSTVKTNRTANYTVPIVMTPTDALTRAGRLSFANFGNSIVFDFRLPHKFVSLEPSDVVTAEDRDNKANLIKITQMILNDDWSLSCSGINWSFNDNISLTADTPRGARDPTFHGPSDSQAFGFDIPLIEPTQEIPGAIQIYNTVGSLGQLFWEGAAMVRQIDGASALKLYDTTNRASYGTCDVALPDCAADGTTFQTDEDTVITVQGRTFRASSVDTADSELAFLAGTNRALVGRQGRWELIFYRTANELSTTKVEISGILRGRRGTESACSDHQVGDLFIPIPKFEFNRDVISPLDIGKNAVYYAMGKNTTRTPRQDVVEIIGASNMPWAPVRMQMRLGSTINDFGSPNYFNDCGGGSVLSPDEPSRQLFITVTGNHDPDNPAATFDHLVDGNRSNGASTSADFQTGLTDMTLTFDFRPYGFKQRITEIKWEQSNGTSQGTWDFEASDDAVTWTSLASGVAMPAAMDNSTPLTFVNPDGYWYYRLKQVTGTTSNSPWLHEIYLKTMANVDDDDLLISWIRRDRLGEEWVTDPQPISEETEEYELDILSGDTVVRTVSGLTTPQYVYERATQVTDGFAPPLADLRVKVYQISALVGRGFPGDATMHSS